jgi:DNA end-binding protein Ku
MYYADEVRRFDEIETGGEQKIRTNELDMARRLVEQLATADFRPEQYKDEYRGRLQEVVQKKMEGEEVTVAEPEKPRAQVIDLMEALKASLAKGPRVAGRAPAPAAREPAGKRRPAAAAARRETQGTKRRAQKK